MEETTIQRSPVPVRRGGRTGFSRRTKNNRSMFPAECHAEKHSHATDTLAYERGQELEGEKLSRKVSIRVEARPEIPQKDKSVMPMECKTDKTTSEDEDTRRASIQQTTDMLEHNIYEHMKQGKRLPKKPLVQGPLKQTPENIKTRSHSLRTTLVKDSTREERRANCTHQWKECSN